MAFEFNDGNFTEEALSGVSVVDFWAEWCGPCKLIGPVIEDLASDLDGKVKVGKLNVDTNPETSIKYGVRSIPTILIFKDGELVHKHVGTTTKAKLAEAVNQFLS